MHEEKILRKIVMSRLLLLRELWFCGTGGGALASKLARPTPVPQTHTFGAKPVHDENRFA